jgi:hypothetical protein
MTINDHRLTRIACAVVQEERQGGLACQLRYLYARLRVEEKSIFAAWIAAWSLHYCYRTKALTQLTGDVWPSLSY